MPKRNDIGTRCLRVKAAAKYIGVGPDKLRALVHRGELSLVNHEENAPWQLDKPELDDWIDNHKTSLG